MTIICIPHQATVQYLIPIVLLTLKIPYTWAFFWTESGFISAYRPEHRHSHSAWGHPWGKNHTESIWRALTSPRNNFILISWETWMSLSAAGHSQVNHILCDHVPLYEQWFTLPLFTSVISLDPHSKTVTEPEQVYNTPFTDEKLILRGSAFCSSITGLVQREHRSFAA